MIQTGLDTSWRLQRKMGASLGIVPRILPVETAVELETAYSGAEPEERLEIAKGLKKNFGSYAGQALREMRLPLKHQVALQKAWEENSTYLAQRLMTVIDKKDSDFALPSSLQTEDVWNRFDAAFSESDFGKYLNGLAGKFPGVSAFQMGCKAVHDLLGKLVFDFVEKGNRPEEATRNAVELYTRNFKTFADKDVGFVVMPMEIHKDWLERGLLAIREKAADMIASSVPPGQSEGSGQEEQQTAMKVKIRDDILGAVWVNTGPGVTLVLPESGRPVPLPNGRPFVVPLKLVEAFGLNDLYSKQVRDNLEA